MARTHSHVHAHTLRPTGACEVQGSVPGHARSHCSEVLLGPHFAVQVRSAAPYGASCWLVHQRLAWPHFAVLLSGVWALVQGRARRPICVLSMCIGTMHAGALVASWVIMDAAFPTSILA